MVASPLPLADRWERIRREFAELKARERLELLLDFSEGLPKLPDRYASQRNSEEHRVHECRTPVYLWIELVDGRVQVHGDVAPEAPTVKGFVAVMLELFNGATPEEIKSLPSDLLSRLGLIEALGMLRMQGMHAVFRRIQREVARLDAS